MVPVGGSIVYASNKSLIDNLANQYPGRCSINSVLDIFITILEMGVNGYKKLMDEREKNYFWFKNEIIKLT